LSYDLRNHIKSWKTDVVQGGGALSFYFSHTLYYLEYFLGRIKNLQCEFSSSENSMNKGETEINMTLSFESGCVGSIHMDIADASQQKHIIEFHGKRGKIVLQNISNDFVDNFELSVNTQKVTQKIRPDTRFSLSYDGLEDSRIKVIKPLIERFINWCNTGVAAKPDFQDGLRVQELIEMARISNSKCLRL
jgi:predicted dehydrogenase